MEYTLVNAITASVGIVFVYNGYRLVRTGKEDLSIFVMSLVVGLGLIFVAVFPNIFQVVATILGLELKARAILILSNLVLFVLATYLINRISRLHKDVSALNEELSLLRATIREDDD